ncbi:YugN family protein [Paenibacillus roseipurpureus]|uniref:YugN family protein n=1 Tax=Paenibacillus roseopurpureus TaxID=2918901 RepID=A0AA96LM46_9BACL|nr:YugN family protein [Paenibacillus sp. MBLB1832]WNR43553.1 YugN family protein [Paenibacillus sp. MBLB1832]
MKPLSSSLEQVQESFDKVRAQLEKFDFTLGGGWEYDHGYFDRYLDEAHKVWLRIPVQVITGRIEGDTEATDAVVEVGQPFVLKHVYNEGLDEEAEAETYGALIDQFQAPLDADASIEEKWVKEAANVLNSVEKAWIH